MDADDASVAEGHHRFADLIEVVKNLLLVEGRDITHLGGHQLQDELGAVAVGEVAVLVELGQVGLSGAVVLALGLRSIFVLLSVEGLFHAVEDIYKTGSAAVDHACLPEDFKLGRGFLQSLSHCGIEDFEKLLEGVCARSCRIFDSASEDGQDRAFHGLCNSLVGLVHAASESFEESRHICFFMA